MDSSAAQPPEFDRYRRIASPIHFLLLLLALGILAYFGVIRANHARSVPGADHLASYLRTILQEWLLLGFVLLGVKLSGAPFSTVLGDRWSSLGQLLRDVGIGAAFLVVSMLVVNIVGPLLGMKHDNSAILYMLPHGQLETALWFVIAISAGICEEAVYRGYLQRQFTAFTKNVPLGILLSALAFGLSHSYQGFSRAAVIVIGGVLSGALAHWRKTVRPGMFAHAFQDLLPLVIKH